MLSAALPSCPVLSADDLRNTDAHLIRNCCLGKNVDKAQCSQFVPGCPLCDSHVVPYCTSGEGQVEPECACIAGRAEAIRQYQLGGFDVKFQAEDGSMVSLQQSPPVCWYVGCQGAGVYLTQADRISAQKCPDSTVCYINRPEIEIRNSTIGNASLLNINCPVVKSTDPPNGTNPPNTTNPPNPTKPEPAKPVPPSNDTVKYVVIGVSAFIGLLLIILIIHFAVRAQKNKSTRQNQG